MYYFCFRSNTDTGSVEYNQLDPLLRANGYRNGDQNDKNTGFSPFPGNINQLLFDLAAYDETLQKTKGLMPEFVNPKYKDDKKTIFKKPTRLECMMQDFPTVLDGDDATRVGFTSIDASLCFSPVKNATADGVALQENGTHPGTAATGEADQYAAVRKILRSIGCQIAEAEEDRFAGITVVPGPAIVLKPNFVACPGEYKAKFPSPEKVSISSSSTLIVRGKNVVIKSLKLDGCLIVDVRDDREFVVENLTVQNEGWVIKKDDFSTNEVVKMRGYVIDRRGARRIELGSGMCSIL